MASFKNIFIRSKMNKDLDDRLLPQGEYRNAINIQVSKSESEDVGALENVLGNEMVFDFQSVTKSEEDDLICVGYLVSEVDSSVFLFLTDNTVAKNPYGVYEPLAQNYIVRLIISPNTSIQSTVLVQGPFLNFYEDSPIHGVNLLEDLLFWTDNRNQPRKIRVNAAADDSNYYNIEDTISVAKYMPYNAPMLWQEITADMAADNPNLSPAVGSYETTMKDVVSQDLPDGSTGNPYYNTNYQGDPDYLEDKFVRFSYRFKFDDGEYSVFAPFTQECFIPKQDGYFLYTNDDDNDMSAAYRSTVVDFMENKVNQIDLLIDLPKVGDPNYVTTLENVTNHFKIVEIDILYKESDSLAVAVVDTITSAQISAQFNAANPSNTYRYTYSGTKPFRTLPEDQLIRVYDKVPVKALGQEVISNRIVYSNFQTKHTPPIINYNVGAGAKKSFDVTTSPNNQTSWNTNIIEYPNSTLKQNRNYQAGFVFSDRFSRTTSTVLSNSSDTTFSGPSATQLSTVYSEYNPSGVDIGLWPGDSLFVDVKEKIQTTPINLNLYPGVYNGDPSDANYNPLGFYTWKVVVKQQEQDYYNVYLPGAITAYPILTDLELGVTSHITLINDNINKVPRDLSEVGPDQKQFRSSVRLFGRVENTLGVANGTGTPPISTNFGVVNKQYFPSRFADTVSTVSNMFDMFNIEVGANYNNDYDAAFYEAESNPLIGRVSTSDRFGQIDPPQPSSYSIQNLAVYETEPVESRLDIYWETSSSGTISDLNDQIDADGNQTIFNIVNLDWYVSEYFGIYSGTPSSPEPGGTTDQPLPVNGLLGRFRSVVTGQFQFEDSVGNPIQTIIDASFTVTDADFIDRTSDFELIKIPGTLNGGPGSYTDYRGNITTALAEDSFIIVNKIYRIYTTADVNQMDFVVTISGRDGDPAITDAPLYTQVFTSSPIQGETEVDNLNTIIVGGETFGDGATSWGQTSTIVDYAKECPPPPYLQVPVGLAKQIKFYGSNGTNALSSGLNNQSGLQWSISGQTQNGSAVTIFTINTNGEVSDSPSNPASGVYDLEITLSGPDSSFDTCSFQLIVGEIPADGSFSIKNSLLLQTNYAYILSAHNTVANAFDDIESGTGKPFTEMNPAPQNLAPNTALIGVEQTTTGCSGQPGAQDYNYLERNQIPSNDVTLASALTKGTAYISLQTFINAVVPSQASPIVLDNHFDASWAIEYRPTPTSNWELARDIEGNVLSFNTIVDSNAPTNPVISNKDGIEATIPVSNPGGTPNPITQQTDIIYGASGGAAAYNNWFRTSAENTNTSGGSFGGPSRRSDHGKWAVVGKSPYPSETSKFGEYRVIIQRLGGSSDNTQSCAAPIGTGSDNGQNNYNTSGAYIKTGDFYYDLGDEISFGYEINTSLFSNRFDAKENTTFNKTVYAREGIHRYVTKFYEDASLQTTYTGYSGDTNDRYLSYIATLSSGTDVNGIPYTTPYNDYGTTKGLALAAEGASYKGGSGYDWEGAEQNLRVWTCDMNKTSGLKVKGSAQPR